METVFFLISLSDDLIYGTVLSILQKYGKLEIKGQRAKTKDLKAGLKNPRRLSHNQRRNS